MDMMLTVLRPDMWITGTPVIEVGQAFEPDSNASDPVRVRLESLAYERISNATGPHKPPG